MADRDSEQKWIIGAADRLHASLQGDLSLEECRSRIRDILKSVPVPPGWLLKEVVERWAEKGGVDPVIMFMVENYYLTFHPGRGVRQSMRGTTPNGKLSAELNRKVVLQLNRGRGDLYEKGYGANFVVHALENRFPGKPVRVQEEVRVITVPNRNGRTCRRRYDIFAQVTDRNIGVEIKSGRIYRSRFIREQIAKDAALLKSSAIDECYRLLFRGASGGVLGSLERAGISFFDFAFDVENELTP
ncbi:MAG: hypothetical protein HQL66_02035 [Magnetococcales bacterium]|nr:hypothetical protein [Magnetococcales bacterium]